MQKAAKKTWRKPQLCEQSVALEVTAYQAAEIDVVI